MFFEQNEHSSLLHKYRVICFEFFEIYHESNRTHKNLIKLQIIV